MKRKSPTGSYKRRIIKDLCAFKIKDAFHAIRLRGRVKALQAFLHKRDIQSDIKQHYRSRVLAHRWSTAYHIVNGGITMKDLRELENGRDQDGNLWYKKEWDTRGRDSDYANASKKIVVNAMKIGQAEVNFAEEGYACDHPFRRPNLSAIPVSRHVLGRAIDLQIDWAKMDGAWSSKAEAIISSFGLKRPYRDEPWHLELDRDRKHRFTFFIELYHFFRKTT